MASQDSIRASDQDREAVATALRQHLTDGRLTMDEFEERLDTVYRAKTYGDLKTVLVDLPRTTTFPTSNPVPALVRRDPARRWRRGWSRYVRVNVTCWCIWAALFVSSGGHSLQGLWPVWVAVPWGAWRGSRALERRHQRATLPGAG